MNPLLEVKFQIPFDQIQAEHVEPAIDALLAQATAAVEKAVAAPDLLDALDNLTEPLDYAIGVVRHLESVATTPALRAAFNAVQPKTSAFYSSIPLNQSLWNALRAFAATDQAKSLTGTKARFLKKTVDSFKRAGADLDAAGKARLQELDIALAELTTKFSENVLDSTNAWELTLTDEAKLAGLPEQAVAMAQASAASKSATGWRFTLQAPSYIAVMTYLDDAEIRENMWRAYNTRATTGDHDNRALIVKILALRKEKAQLLGFHDFADLVLDDRMAHTGARAQAFVADLVAKSQARFAAENQELEAFAGRKLEPWDVGYWSEKQRAALYDFDEEALRPYFPLESVVNGMFSIFGRILGIRVAETNLPAWDPAVKSYTVHDAMSGQHLGSFYADWFPRENKRGGAWMDSFITGNVNEGLPNSGLICGNLTPPVGDTPSLLTHREAETIFHEFGHLLHHLLTRVEVRSLAGTNVAWDWVELPSQIMENWCWEREALDTFARHYQTGEPLPEDLFQKMKRAKTFRAANAQMRQLGFATVDLALHREWDGAEDVLQYSRRLLQPFSVSQLPNDYAMIAAFTHLFASPVAYGAGYYSYKWAEVLDADAFTRFQKEGVFNAETGRAYRDNILAMGDADDPAQLYRDFMGRDPDPGALLRRAGLA
jgi:oligopeptidase A